MRCAAPQAWGDPAAVHVWWPADVPVEGEHVVNRGGCRAGGGVVTAFGTVLSRSDRPRDVWITVTFLDGDDVVVGQAEAVASGVQPGQEMAWSVPYSDPGQRIRECRITDVRYTA